MAPLMDPGGALESAPAPGAYEGRPATDLDRFARRLMAHAIGSGSWQALADHLVAIKAAMNNTGAQG